MLTKEFLDRKFGFFEDLNTTEYAYAHNNPLKYTDPTGHSIWGKIGALTLGSLAAGPLGQWLAVNMSDSFSEGERAFVNRTVVLAAAASTGGAAAGALGATTGASGFIVGAMAGGFVGGLGFRSLGLGSFNDGFTAGAIAGGIAGYKVGVSNGMNGTQSPNSSSNSCGGGQTLAAVNFPILILGLGGAAFLMSTEGVGSGLDDILDLKDYIKHRIDPKNNGNPYYDSQPSQYDGPAQDIPNLC